MMITRDPFDRARPHVTYFSAKRGPGIRVVEGKRAVAGAMQAYGRARRGPQRPTLAVLTCMQPFHRWAACACRAMLRHALPTAFCPW
ncbi:hypothetical protein DBR33_18060 [Stenotrophomonas sp. HMWF022]|nr:hypothetical protein DBR20_07645 [Stenotrophomonas sp. HMWF023]PTT37402.1 hypothetical protein DBR33_18060 [Stenotrophomonas sp. HMWF022]